MHERRIGPYLYLPIEVASRELHAKLLLTHFAVRMGYEVVVGWKRLMNQNLHQMPPGIVLFKTLTANDARAMRKARAAGHRVAVIDEEVPGLVATEQKLRWVIPEAVTSSDLIFAAGTDHLDALKHHYPDQVDRFSLTGNPRWDLLRPELRGSHAEEAAGIEAEHGPFIMISTNFGAINSARRTPEETRDWFIATGRLDPSNPDDAVFLRERFLMEESNREALQDLLRLLPARFAKHRFVLRPHPIERTDTWDAFLRGIPRARQIREGAAASWILASDALVHTNCTTGVEAYALGKPALSIQPRKLGIYDIFLSNRVNPLASDAEAALDLLEEWLGPEGAWKGYPPAFRTTFEHFFAGTEGPFACEAILASIRDAFQPALQPGAAAPSWRPGPGYLQKTRTRKHHAMVMPDVDAATVRRLLSGFCHALDAPESFQVESCGQLVFHVHGAAARADHKLPGPTRARLHRLWSRSSPAEPRA